MHSVAVYCSYFLYSIYRPIGEWSWSEWQCWGCWGSVVTWNQSADGVSVKKR